MTQNVFQPGLPTVDSEEPYLYHSLYDHTDLGWINMLRIGMIWVDIKVQYQKFYQI